MYLDLVFLYDFDTKQLPNPVQCVNDPQTRQRGYRSMIEPCLCMIHGPETILEKPKNHNKLRMLLGLRVSYLDSESLQCLGGQSFATLHLSFEPHRLRFEILK